MAGLARRTRVILSVLGISEKLEPVKICFVTIERAARLMLEAEQRHMGIHPPWIYAAHWTGWTCQDLFAVT